jgi:toxin CcdB
MGRFDIYRNPGRTAGTFPYLLDVQSDHVSGLATRLVIPLQSIETFGNVRIPNDLCPIVRIDGNDYFLDTPQLGAIPARELTAFVASASDHQIEIIAALDRVFGGY